MDPNSTPPGNGSPEQPSSSSSGSQDPSSSLWTPPVYPGSGYSSASGSESTPARVEQPSYTQPQPQPQSQPQPQPQPTTPMPSYPPQQGAPTQPYGPPQGGYAPPPQQGQPVYPPQGQYPPQGPYQQPQGQYPQPQYPQPQGQYAPQGYQQPQYAQVQAPAAPAKSGGVPVFVWVLGGILVFIIACSAIFYFTVIATFNSAGNAIKDVVNTAAAGITAVGFTSDMELGNYESAYSYLGGDLKNRYSAKTLEQKWTALAGTNNTFSINTRLGDPKAAGKQTKINWVITPPGKSSVTIELTMDEAGNDWKIVDAKPDLIPNP